MVESSGVGHKKQVEARSSGTDQAKSGSVFSRSFEEGVTSTVGGAAAAAGSSCLESLSINTGIKVKLIAPDR